MGDDLTAGPGAPEPTFAGIDPGAEGAIAFITGRRIEVFDCPFIREGRKKKLDRGGISKLLRSRSGIYMAFVEEVHARPGNGKAGAFTFAMNYSAWLQSLTENSIRHRLVPPERWKHMIGVTKDKATSVARASALFPESAHLFVGKFGGLLDGRAEAALLAYLARQICKLGGTTR